MTVPTPTPARTKIFLSYRRSDTSGHVGRLYDELVGYFGRDRVFMDIDGISPGQNFVDVLTERLRDAAVVLVLIGPRWEGPLDSGMRRIDDDDDFVRMEVVEALTQSGTHVIPVLCAGAVFPATDRLPDALKPLGLRHAFELSDLRWKQDVRRLEEAMQPHVPLEPLVSNGSFWSSPRVMLAVAVLALVLWWGPWRGDRSSAASSSTSSEIPKAMVTPEFPGSVVKVARRQLRDAIDNWADDAYLSHLEVQCDLSAQCTLRLTMISDGKRLFLNWWLPPDGKGQFHQSAGADPRDKLELEGVLELEDAIAKAKGYGLSSSLSSVFLEMFADRDGKVMPIWLLFPRSMPGDDRDTGFCMEARNGARVACRNFRG
jgi:hypothetical protein